MNSTVTIGSPDRKTPGLAWHDRAPELAKWARRYFVRRDRYGGYHRKDNATRPFTKPRDGPEEDCVTVELLERHFRATGTDDVIGAHPLAPGEGGRWAAVDIDAHGEAADPAANERFARAVHGEAAALGLHPLTYESNGKGGYHVVVFFDAKAPDLVPGPILHSFVRWLVRRHAEFGFAKPPETFPKQPTVPADGYGNWFRLVGRHHTRDHWPRVWDGTEWHSGADAVGYVLGIPRDDHALIPLEAIVDAMEPDSPPRPTPGGDGRPGDDFDRRGGERAIRELLIRHGWTHSRDRGDGVSEWTRPGKADGCSATLGFCRG